MFTLKFFCRETLPNTDKLKGRNSIRMKSLIRIRSRSLSVWWSRRTQASEWSHPSLKHPCRGSWSPSWETEIWPTAGRFLWGRNRSTWTATARTLMLVWPRAQSKIKDRFDILKLLHPTLHTSNCWSHWLESGRSYNNLEFSTRLKPEVIRIAK